jgi:AraC-like DNA-binding protein
MAPSEPFGRHWGTRRRMKVRPIAIRRTPAHVFETLNDGASRVAHRMMRHKRVTSNRARPQARMPAAAGWFASAVKLAQSSELAVDTLAPLISMLRPQAVYTKMTTGSGRWAARYGQVEAVGFGVVLAGRCYLGIGGPPVLLQEGDFVLMPPTPSFSISSDPEVDCISLSSQPVNGEPVLTHHGNEGGDPEFRLLGGCFWFDAANASLIPHLLPDMLHVWHAQTSGGRLLTTIALLVDEARSQLPGRDLIVERLVEVLLVEALRVSADEPGIRQIPGLVQGMADIHLASALRAIHRDAARQWTVADLARDAGLSRSAFSERFTKKVGVPPMEYVMRWRIALAKDMLRRDGLPLEKVAARLGYQSASAFSTAFSREVGEPPGRFARGPECGDLPKVAQTA